MFSFLFYRGILTSQESLEIDLFVTGKFWCRGIFFCNSDLSIFILNSYVIIPFSKWEKENEAFTSCTLVKEWKWDKFEDSGVILPLYPAKLPLPKPDLKSRALEMVVSLCSQGRPSNHWSSEDPPGLLSVVCYLPFVKFWHKPWDMGTVSSDPLGPRAPCGHVNCPGVLPTCQPPA